MVVTGLNRRSRYWTPCSWRASRMLCSLKESAKGSPWSRAKRARTSCRVIIGDLECQGMSGRAPEARRRDQPGRSKRERESHPASLYAAGSDHKLRLQLHQGPTLALMLATFVCRADARWRTRLRSVG